jgi:phosphoglycolate phosphatase-like HAD superfamily hydrolase
MKKLFLFDIDGTILTTHGAGRRAMEAAAADLVGYPVSAEGVSFSGRTDPQIMREVLERSGLSPARAGALLREALARFAEHAARTLPAAPVEILPGVPALLDHLAALPGAQLGLLTGNLEPTAYLKLRTAGVPDVFPFGAFGSDHEERDALPAIAVGRARAHTGHSFSGKAVVIVGDTQHDIRCGRGIGALAVAVCTGRHDRSALARHEPDVLLDDLSDLEAFLDAVRQGVER